MKVLLTRDFSGMEELAAAHEVRRHEGTLGPDAMRAALAEYDAVITTIGDGWTAEVLGTGPHRCRLLANFGVGWNHIDGEAAAAAGVMVSNTPDATTQPTADVALMLILMTCRRAGAAERMLRAGHWGGWRPDQLMGVHPGGKTLGIVGLGRIGKAVRDRARAIGMKVIHFNRSRTGVEGQVDDLHEMLGRSDVVCCCVPGGASTRGLLGRDALAAMPPHAILVNVSRGDVVDEDALIAALEAGALGGAGLDVYANEPEVPEGLMRENTVLMPHIGTATPEVRADMGRMAAANVLALAEGREPPNRVA